MAIQFEDNLTIEADSATHRTCSNCGCRRRVDEFYKDGTNKDGTIRYRRDCKVCYKRSRDAEKALKNPVKVAPPRPKRGTKKR